MSDKPALKAIPLSDYMKLPKRQTRVKLDGQGYVDFFREDGSLIDYPLAIDQINSEHDILAWACHIGAKTWMTKEMVLDFIHLVANERGIKIYK